MAKILAFLLGVIRWVGQHLEPTMLAEDPATRVVNLEGWVPLACGTDGVVWTTRDPNGRRYACSEGPSLEPSALRIIARDEAVERVGVDFWRVDSAAHRFQGKVTTMFTTVQAMVHSPEHMFGVI